MTPEAAAKFKLFEVRFELKCALSLLFALCRSQPRASIIVTMFYVCAGVSERVSIRAAIALCMRHLYSCKRAQLLLPYT